VCAYFVAIACLPSAFGSAIARTSSFLVPLPCNECPVFLEVVE